MPDLNPNQFKEFMHEPSVYSSATGAERNPVRLGAPDASGSQIRLNKQRSQKSVEPGATGTFRGSPHYGAPF